ncbi:MAG: hypothetical protein RLP16_02270 [Alphaproteobacteria bacterium]
MASPHAGTRLRRINTGSGLAGARLSLALVLSLILGLAGPVLAQTAPEGDPALEPVPPAALTGALSGSEDGMALVDSYLRQGEASPKVVARRARQLLLALKDAGGNAEQVTAAVSRVAQVAATGLSSSRVIQVGVERDFRPREGTFAFDFGPPDAPAAAGFERIAANDPRIRLNAEGGSAIRRPGEGSVLDDGIIGLEGFKVALKNGTYRLVLLTEDIGDPTLFAPFGSGIRVNGVPIRIQTTRPDQWTPMSILGNDSRSVIEGSRSFSGDQGGAIVIEVVVTNGELDLEIPGFNRNQLKSYLTGAVIEPADQESQFAPSAEAEEYMVNLNEIYELESQVAQAVSETLTDVLPDTGQEQLLDALGLPDPEFADVAVPSPN